MSFAGAQSPCNLRIAGKLVATDGTSLPMVEIFIEAGHRRTFTDSLGNFHIQNLCADTLIMEADLGESGHIHLQFHLLKDTSIVWMIPLKPSDIQEVILSAERKRGNPQEQFGKTQILRSAGMSTPQMLLQLPSMNLLYSGNTIAKPMSQGLYGLRLPVMINGQRQEGQQWGDDHALEADALGYDEIRIIRGAESLVYGPDVLGGVLELKNNPNAHSGEYDITAGYAFQTNSLGNAAFARIYQRPEHSRNARFLNVSVKKNGDYSAPGYVASNTGMQEATMTTGYRRQRGKNRQSFNTGIYHMLSGILSASHIGNITDLLSAIHRDKPATEFPFTYKIKTPRQAISSGYTNWDFSWIRCNATHQAFAGIQYNRRREFDFHRNKTNQFPQLDLSLFTTELKFNSLYTVNSKLQYQHGYSALFWIHRYGGYYFIPDFEAASAGIYSALKYESNAWKSFFIFRLDSRYQNPHLSGIDSRLFGNYSTAATLRYHKNKFQFEGSLMRLWRAPWFNELYSNGVHHGSVSFESGNKNLRTEKMYKTELVFTYKSRFLHQYISVYGNYMPGFIQAVPAGNPVLTVRGAFPAYHYRQFAAANTGIDFISDLRLFRNFAATIKSSWMYARNLDSQSYINWIPPFSASVKFTYRLRHFHCVAGLIHTAKQWQYNDASDYLPPPPSYTLTQLELGWENLLRRRNMNLELGIYNIANKSYRVYTDRFRYFVNMPGRNVLLRFTINIHHHKEKTLP
ncbi:MAG: TonB-dependent receptor [Bacteroidetes bacterium]|nr:TonB-dependent receptor [Bacteroidota bacterium]